MGYKMLRGILILALFHLVHTNHLGSLGPPVYNTQFDVWKFTEDFFNTFNSLMNINQQQLPNPEIFSDKPIYPKLYPTIPPKKPVFKTFALNDMRPGSKKVFKMNDGQGIAFRSKDGNAGGMSFSSGPGKGFSFGGTFKGPNNGEFVMSQSGPGSRGKVTYTEQIPDFAKGLFKMFPFIK